MEWIRSMLLPAVQWLSGSWHFADYFYIGARQKYMKDRINREKLFRMVSVGVVDEPVNQAYDIISTGALLLNLAASIMLTFDRLKAEFGPLLLSIEAATVLFFAIDYALRLITANYLYPESNERDSLVRYIFSFSGIIDLLSFLPYYLPVFFPAGIAAFRMFRVVRIFRLFRSLRSLSARNSSFSPPCSSSLR